MQDKVYSTLRVTKTTVEDIEAFKENIYAKDSKDLMKASIYFQDMYSFKRNNEVLAIAMFYEYYPHCFRCGVLIQEDINKHFLKFFRDWMNLKIIEKKCLRLETEGICDKTLERFHKFLGFKKETVINNGGYIKWVK